MPVNWVTYPSCGRERDMLSILMDSNLYFDLSLQERRILLDRIVESYHSTDLSSTSDPFKPELASMPDGVPDDSMICRNCNKAC